MVIMVCWEVGRLHDFLSGGMRVCGNQQYHFALKGHGMYAEYTVIIKDSFGSGRKTWGMISYI